MAKCNDCWCEHFDKNKGNCDLCLKNEAEKDNPDLRVILERRVIREMEPDKNKTIGQIR